MLQFFVLSDFHEKEELPVWFRPNKDCEEETTVCNTTEYLMCRKRLISHLQHILSLQVIL